MVDEITRLERPETRLFSRMRPAQENHIIRMLETRHEDMFGEIP